MQKSAHQTVGFLFVLLAGIGFGFLGVFGRFAFNSGIAVNELLFWRFVTAGILLFLGLLIFKRDLIKLSKKQVLTSIALGVGGYAVFSTLYFRSIQGVSVPLAAMLLFTFPIFVSLGAHLFLKERMNRLQWISLAVACLGLGILLWGPVEVHKVSAVLCGFGAAITYALYVLVSGKVQKNVPALSSSLYVILSAAIALGIFSPPSLERAMSFSTEQMLIILGLATICTIAPLTLFLAGLQHLPSSQASILVMIEPVVATIAAATILGEVLSLRQIAGGILVLIALFINTRAH